MGRFVDSLIAYRILRMLVTPFEETDAFRLGIIDAKGKELKKMASLNTVEERDAYSILHRMIFRIKKIIEKVPVENKRLVSFAAALSLIKEHYQNNKEPLDLEMQYLNRLNTNLNEELEFIEQYEKKIFTFKQFVEEAPANNAAATPGIDGFTPETLGVPKGKQPKLLRRKKIYA
jgi:hypothetical protein